MEDWKSAHLTWIDEHKSFHPYNFNPVGVTYAEVMSNLYYGHGMTPISQEVAKIFYDGDRAHHKATRLLLKPQGENRIYWVTVGFDKSNYTNNDKAIKFVRKVLSSKWVVDGQAVLEFNGERGFRPHSHFLIEVVEAVKNPSDVVDRIWKIGISRPFNGLFTAKNHIELTFAHDNCHNYLNGIKKEPYKQELVKKDKEYRILHDIPHKFQK